jgi:hypothetical protein
MNRGSRNRQVNRLRWRQARNNRPGKAREQRRKIVKRNSSKRKAIDPGDRSTLIGLKPINVEGSNIDIVTWGKQFRQKVNPHIATNDRVTLNPKQLKIESKWGLVISLTKTSNDSQVRHRELMASSLPDSIATIAKDEGWNEALKREKSREFQETNEESHKLSNVIRTVASGGASVNNNFWVLKENRDTSTARTWVGAGRSIRIADGYIVFSRIYQRVVNRNRWVQEIIIEGNNRGGFPLLGFKRGNEGQSRVNNSRNNPVRAFNRGRSTRRFTKSPHSIIKG